MPRSPLVLTLALALALFSNAYADLVAHYALDETDPGNAMVTDSFGQNHGMVVGTGTTKNFQAPHGTGYDFTLSSGVNIPPASEIRPTDQFTITWWFRPTTLNQFDRMYESLSGTGNDGNGIRIDLGSSPGNRVRALLRDGNGSTNTTVTNPLVLSTGNWYFFALRYDSILGEAKVTVLQDTGGDIAAATISAATTTSTSLGTNAISHATGVFIAADDSSASGSNDFGGAMDDIAFFQTGDSFGVLSDADLAEIYNDGALAFDPPAPKPTINSFTADQTDVTSGTTVTFSWDVADADTIEIDPTIGAVANPTGSTSIVAGATEIYTLTATNAEGSTSQAIQITVDGLELPPEISEFVASNSSFDDGDGNSSDWIEIHNRNANSFDLSGFHLTDQNTDLQKWQFPAGTMLAPDEYFVVFASGQATSNYVDASGNLHTNFNLSSGGEYLALVAPDGSTIIQEFAPNYPPQKTDTSYTAAGYLSTPTPRAENIGTAQSGFVGDTRFDIDRGFYTSPIDVTVETDTPGAAIYYTLDGSPPSPSNGTLFTTAINISSTTVLRAAAFKDDFIPSNVDTQTYLFLADVITQSNSPPNTTPTWAGRTADYEMDPEIVNDPDYAADLIPALRAFPSLSIAIEPDDFYGAQGIYQNPQSDGSSWERAVSAELIIPDGSEPGFQVDAGMRIQGGSSRNPDTPKHSLSLRFRNQYGAGKLDYPMFRDAPYGKSATQKFDFLQLRSGYNHGWVHRHYYQSRHAQYNRDQFANDLLLALGSTGSHGRWVHLYINGVYWGIYHIHERPDQNFMASYFGGDGDDYDAINSNRATSGTNTAYNALKAHGAAGLSDSNAYETMKTHLDIDSFIDYMLVNFYTGNRDWDGHNWRAAGQGPGGVPFHYFTWDTEFAISPNNAGVNSSPSPLSNALNTNVTGKNNNNGPTGVHQDLTGNADYRLRFADRAHAALFNGGPMSPTGATAIWRTRSDLMDIAIVAESARWGDFRRDVDAGRWTPADFDLYTRDDHYLPDQQWIIDTYFPQRRDIVLAQLRSRNLYPATDPPAFSQVGDVLTMTNPNAGGTIHYTTDGSDPRDPGASVYSAPITLTISANYRARVLEGAVWSALQSSDIIAGVPADASNLTVSELYYNPPGPAETGEFIELTNISAVEIDLSKVEFVAGINYTFPLGTTLAAGAQIVVLASDFTGNLDNAGETITLNDASGAVIESFTYDDDFPWPEAADGDGFSLVRISPMSQLDPDDPTSWRASTGLGGNSGSSDATTFAGGSPEELLVYAFGSSGEPAAGFLNGDPILTFPRNLAADDLIYRVEHSTDLITWTPATNLVSETAPTGGFSTQTFLEPQPEPPFLRHFFRVLVQLR